VTGPARLLGDELPRAAEPPRAQRRLAAQEKHAGQLDRLQRRAVDVSLLEVMRVKLFGEC
jgi:hypothetical protein